MLDGGFRNLKSRFLEPLLRPITLHPLVFTLMSLLAGLAALLAFWFDRRLLAVLLWLGCRIFDGLDGMVARVSGKQSDLGGYIDLVVDFFLYAALPLVIALRLGELVHFAVAALLLGIFYLNAAVWMAASALLEKRRVQRKQTSIIMPRGLVEGFETMIFNCLMLALPGYFVPLALGMAGLTLLGALIRFIQTLPALEDHSEE